MEAVGEARARQGFVNSSAAILESLLGNILVLTHNWKRIRQVVGTDFKIVCSCTVCLIKAIGSVLATSI